jgi:Lar family restriction alleviation protein
MKTELKPCPFCGSSDLSFTPQPEVKHTMVRGVLCRSCGGQQTTPTNNDEDAIKAWNRRDWHDTKVCPLA